MATKKTAKNVLGNSAVHISGKLQSVFLLAVTLSWFLQVVMLFSVFLNPLNIKDEILFMLFQLVQMLFPALLFAVALIYTWKRYTTLLHRFFVAGVMSIIAQTIFGVFNYIFSFIRSQFNLFSSNMPTDASGYPYVFDSVLTLMCLGVFVLAIGYLDARKRYN